MTMELSGNPILPGRGVCDPHVRIFNDTAYLYATHDKEPANQRFVMEDWWVWSSPDLVHWTHACTLRPAETYLGPDFHSCWATDAAHRNGQYYWYLSEAAKRVAVVVSDTPVGPWRDPLGKPMIGEADVPDRAYDPGILMDDDGTAYIVFGVWNYYLARLNDDMISLAERPQLLTIHNPEGPYGRGKTDDKPYLHRRGDLYYLSWGCYYATARNPYGPYECHGSFITEENIPPSHRYAQKPITYDRHGSFFEWRGQWFFICNDMSQTGTPFFRDSSLFRVSYQPDGLIEPLTLDPAGVSLIPSAKP